jgi:hypothetical protein
VGFDALNQILFESSYAKAAVAAFAFQLRDTHTSDIDFLLAPHWSSSAAKVYLIFAEAEVFLEARD